MLTWPVAREIETADGDLTFPQSNLCKEALGHQKAIPSGSMPSSTDGLVLPPTLPDGLRVAVDERPRFGARSAAIAKPNASFRRSKSSASRSTSPSARRILANAPMETPGSPFSSRAIVLAEVLARTARSDTAIQRRSRAARTSLPSRARDLIVFGELTTCLRI